MTVISVATFIPNENHEKLIGYLKTCILGLYRSYL